MGVESHVTLDLFSSNVDVRGDMMEIPFEDGSFDMVYCSHVLEHVADDRKALEELRRVLRPGGRALLQVPISGDVTIEDVTVTTPEERRERFGQEDHVRTYGADFCERPLGCGFSVERIFPAERVGVASAVRHGVPSDESVFSCMVDVSS